MRVRASVTATRLVSIVIHRRPHCSATYAVVPEPQVGSRTRSPGSVDMRIHRSTIFEEVSITYFLSYLYLQISAVLSPSQAEQPFGQRADFLSCDTRV